MSETNQLPHEKGHRSESNRQNSYCLRALLVLAMFSAAMYGIIAFLSLRFKFDSPTSERPIVVVLFIFAMLFAAYLIAIRLATKAKQDSRLLLLIVIAAVVFRIPMLFSMPIQEVDIYRYLWDGAVSAQSVSPFRYPPNQVLLADKSKSDDPDLRKLARLRDQNPAVAEVLRRVHFGVLPTIYPPTSQAVFLCCSNDNSE